MRCVVNWMPSEKVNLEVSIASSGGNVGNASVMRPRRMEISS